MSQDTPSREAQRAAILAQVRAYAEGSGTSTFVPGMTPVPPSGKVIAADELTLMTEAVLDGWLTTGRFNTAFEAAIGQRLGANFVLTTNSGSSANLLAFAALTSPLLGDRAIQPGDEVITVAAGFPTTVNPILQHGAVPVFVDIDIPTYNIDVSQLEAARSPRTRAVMIAHTLGNPFNLAAVRHFCNQHQLWLVEDCCDAFGSHYDGKPVGSFGDLGTLSFYPAHHITTGEGGAVFTRNQTLKRAAESFRDWGRDCYCQPGRDNTCGRRFCHQLGELPYGYDHKYTYSHLGYNLKMTDMQAACGLAQLGHLDEFVAARRRNFAWLHARLQSCAEFMTLPQATPNSDPAWFGFAVTLTPAAQTTRTDLLTYLDERKIGTRLLFGGNLTRQPYMLGRHYRCVGDLARTDEVMNHTFWFGVWPGLGEAQLDYVATALETYFGVNF